MFADDIVKVKGLISEMAEDVQHEFAKSENMERLYEHLEILEDTLADFEDEFNKLKAEEENPSVPYYFNDKANGVNWRDFA